MFSGLSLDQAPPFEVPLKFFILAVIFAISAGFMLFFIDVNSSDLKFISFVHLITIGFFAMIMVGALFQMLPVVTGVVYKSSLFSNTIFIGFIIGLLSFVYGLIFEEFKAFFITKVAFAISIYLFSIVTIYKLFFIKFKTPTSKNIILSLFSFIIAFSSSLLLLLLYQGVALNIDNIKQIHILFAYFGWIFLLILGVSFQVVPMFWVTKAYPFFCREYIGYVIFFTIVLFAFKVISIKIFSIIIFICLLAYSTVTLLRFRQRKRKVPDISIKFWQIGIISLLLAICLFIYSAFSNQNYENILGFLFAYFTISVIIAMIYKIIPFLTWFHLSSKGVFDIPTTKEMIPKKMDKIHLYLHLLNFAIGLIYLIFLNKVLIFLFATIFIISMVILLYNILSVVGYYFKFKVLV